MPDQTKTERKTCPDGGVCHHECNPGPDCFRVRCCGPLSGVFPGDQWPKEVKDQQPRPNLALATIEVVIPYPQPGQHDAEAYPGVTTFAEMLRIDQDQIDGSHVGPEDVLSWGEVRSVTLSEY